MKKLLLFLAILSPLQTSLSYAQVRSKTIDERPLAAAIQAALKNRPAKASDIQFLLDQGIREFNLGDFTQLSANEKPLAEHEMNARAMLESSDGKRTEITNPGKNIVVEFSDPKTGKIMSFKTVFSYSKQGSPEALYEQYAETVTKRPNVKEFIHNLPMESMVFYYGLGLSNILTLITAAEDDPLVLDRYLKSLVDPLGQASFMAFIVGNRAGSYAMNSLLFSSLLSKTMSPKAKLRISKILIPQLGMAVGGLVSNGMYDLVNIVKGCSDLLLNQNSPIEQRKKVCGQAMKDVFSSENAYRYATSAISMITTGFVMAYGPGALKAVGSAIGRIAIIRNIAMTVSTVANLIPIPQAKAVTVIKTATLGAIHLMVFLKLDEWVFHPLYHHTIEKYASIGPELLKYQDEMQSRLAKTSVRMTQEKIKKPLNKEAEEKLNKYLAESAKNFSALTMFDKPTPIDIPTYTVQANVFEFLIGGTPEAYTPLSNSKKLWNWTYGWVLPDFKDNQIKTLS
ncbi:MAG: hypothetical protein KDD37_06565, partial [Bdellovibrionales bacterium]|nr:hypothetical protein [Bdellovibrionales bacterium]